MAEEHDDTPNFSHHQIKLIEEFATGRYVYPRVFVLTAQVAYLRHLLGAGKTPAPSKKRFSIPAESTAPPLVTTGQILAQARLDTMEVRRGLGQSLELALELNLLRQKKISDDAGQGWELTTDGGVFLLRGIKTRTAMRKFSRLSEEEICCQVSADEIEEWELDGEDRAQRIAGHRGDVIKKRGVRSRKGGRKELAVAIERASIERIKGSEIHTLWSALVR